MLAALIPRLSARRVLVVGDVFLDEYLTGEAARLSREAPIPVLEFVSRRLIPGGAANPAATIAALGSQAVQIGIIGADAEGETLRHLLTTHGIDAGALIVDASRPTSVKTRILAQMGLRFPQQVARIDRLSRAPIADTLAAAIAATTATALRAVDAMLLSDYQTGMLTPALVGAIRDAAAATGTLLTADAQGQFDKYAGFGLVKCNAAEASAYLGRVLSSDDDFGDAARALCDRLRLTRAMVITRGADGATFADSSGAVVHCPAPAVTDVFDTVGAGDTAIAVATLALIAGANLAAAVLLANHASGLVVRRFGNYAPTPAELHAAVIESGEHTSGSNFP
jgi:rfaE bifunctional protein kinase chain/domain